MTSRSPLLLSINQVCPSTSSISHLLVLLVVGALLGLFLPLKAAGQDFTSDTSPAACDDTWDDVDCWNVTGTQEDGNAYPSDPGESVLIDDSDEIIIKDVTVTVDGIDVTSDAGGAFTEALGINGVTLTATGSVSLSGGGKTLIGNSGVLDVNGTSSSLTVGSSTTLQIISGEAQLEGDFTSDGTLNAGTNTIRFDSGGGNTQELDGNFKIGGNGAFGTVVVGSNTTLDAKTNLTEVDITGDLTVNGSVAGSGVNFEFNGNSNQSISADGVSFGELRFDNTGGGTMTVDGTPVISSGRVEVIDGTLKLDGGGARLDVGGNFVVNSSFNANGQPVKLTSASLLNGQVNEISFSTLNVSGGEAQLKVPISVSGDLIADGGFDTNDNGVTLNASSGSQTISSSITPSFDTLRVEHSGSGISSTTDIDISDTQASSDAALVLTNGAFDIQDNTVILGTDGRIEYDGGTLTNSTSASAKPTVSAKQTVGGATQGWRFLASPVQGETFDTFLDDASPGWWTQGFTGSDTGTDGEYSVGKRDASSDSWTPISDITDPVTEGRGFIAVAFSDVDNDGNDEGATTINVEGNVREGGSGFTFSNKSFFEQTSGRFNLVGNPYPSPMDWDNTGGWDFSGLANNYAYIWDVDGGGSFDPGGTVPNGAYRSTSGTSTSGGSIDGDIIPMFQAFFVESATSGTFAITDPSTASASREGTFYKSTQQNPPELQFNLNLEGLHKKTTMVWSEKGTLGLDQYDAYQLAPFSSDNPYVSLHTVLSDANNTASKINTQPRTLTSEMEVPVVTKAHGCYNGSPISGTATLNWSIITDLPDNWSLTLTDNQTGDEISIRDQSSYDFDLSSSESCSKRDAVASRTGTRSSGGDPPMPEPIEYSSDAKNQSSSAPNTRFTLKIDPDALPVELNGFNGDVEGQDAVLTWETASETNNAGFRVQRKRNGTFTNLEGAFVEGAGTTSQPQSYRYRVTDLDAGTHTFRLKQVDTDGSASFSDPLDVKVGVDGQYSLSTYPNPVQDQATVKFAVKEQAEVTISLYNTLGQRVKTLYRDTPPAEQTQRATITTEDLSSGLYIVRLRGKSFTATQRVTVVK